MKWFKHETDALHSEKLNWLIDNFGMEGYGRWHRLLELVAERMDGSERCYAEYSIQKWSSFLFGKPFKIVSFLKQIENKMEIKLEQNSDVLRITIPKLLENRDNYSKNLQATSKKLASKELEVEEDKDKEIIDTGAQRARPSSRGTRISDDFQLNPENREIAAKAGLNGNIDFIFAKFRSYWEGASGSKGTKMNWTSTWRNWCLNEAERQGSKKQSHTNRNDGSPVDDGQKWKDYKSMSREDYLNKYPEDRKYAN